MKKSFLVVGLILLMGLCACNDSKKEEILVLHAGSLSIPFKHLARAFMAKYPNTKVLLEGYGSRTCARQITDLDRRVDVMASADSAVIRNLLMPGHTGFCIDFTTNEMVLMYRAGSRFAGEINSDNWYEILLRPGVQYGHSNPNSDPCGYRSLLTWQLAEKHYRVPGLSGQLIKKMLPKNIRPKETDLIALLEAGELDYIFIYRSVADQHKAPYVTLPEEINLKNPAFADFYAHASINITGKKPGQWINKKGAAMVYGITIPSKAKNPRWGVAFLDFVLGPEGQKIMAQNGQQEILPPRVDNREALPAELKKYFNK